MLPFEGRQYQRVPIDVLLELEEQSRDGLGRPHQHLHPNPTTGMPIGASEPWLRSSWSGHANPQRQQAHHCPPGKALPSRPVDRLIVKRASCAVGQLSRCDHSWLGDSFSASYRNSLALLACPSPDQVGTNGPGLVLALFRCFGLARSGWFPPADGGGPAGGLG